ncbi:hypothetical protein [Winogradskyella forsetii]|uniref:hypothetical protein n=1 Tax=Winogradskyella forsetii TaxID=2686077 RepID=UPI0015C16184|nr:hypothetical protein [Winogradskyella forsetii]
MKTLHTILLTLLISVSVWAQGPDIEKIKALKIAHITEHMDLSEGEAQKFWPIYNANEAAKHKLWGKFSEQRNEKSADQLTESKANAFLLNMISLEKEKTELRSKLINDLLEILPAKKVVALVQAEESFRRKMIEEYKERHRKMKQN